MLFPNKMTLYILMSYQYNADGGEDAEQKGEKDIIQSFAESELKGKL